MKKLAVLIPAYNAATYLNESIDSVLNQTFADFDLYVYDDCSNDDTEEVVSAYNDSRIFYRRNPENLGIAKTLNKGLEELLSFYEYIVRMDADDWSYPERLEKQMDFLAKNQEVVLCGTQGYWLKDINQNPVIGWEYPVRNEYIKLYLLFGATFGHSSVFIRSDFFQKHHLRYNESITTCEDWDLWIRVSRIGKLANLPDFLMKYRILEDSNHRSPQKIKKHMVERSKIISNYWADFGIVLIPEEVFEYYYDMKEIPKVDFEKKIKILINIFNQLYGVGAKNLDFSEKEKFRYLLVRRLLDYWKRSKVSRADPKIWISIVSEVKFMNKIKLMKTLIR